MNTLKYFKTVNKNVPGVYAIVNAYDMKIYIGSTTNLSKRSKQHFSLFKAGNHTKYKLQKDVKKGLRFFILHELNDSEFIKIIEKIYMIQAMEKGFILYNKLGSGTKQKISNDISNDLMYFFNTSERFEKPFQKNFGIKSYNIKNVIYRKERFL